MRRQLILSFVLGDLTCYPRVAAIDSRFFLACTSLGSWQASRPSWSDVQDHCNGVAADLQAKECVIEIPRKWATKEDHQFLKSARSTCGTGGVCGTAAKAFKRLGLAGRQPVQICQMKVRGRLFEFEAKSSWFLAPKVVGGWRRKPSSRPFRSGKGSRTSVGIEFQ